MKKIVVCVNHRANPSQPSCAARGSGAIANCLEAEIAARNLPITVERFYCLGFCEQGPNVRLAPNGQFFHALTAQDMPTLLLAIEQFLRE